MDQKEGHFQIAQNAAHSGRAEITGLERRLLAGLLSVCGDPPIAFSLWTGEQIRSNSRESPVARIVIRERSALFRMLVNPELFTGDDYTAGRVDVEGDFVGCLAYIFRGLDNLPETSLKAKFLRWINRPRANTLAGSRENIHRHYDLGNQFYRHWLDRDRMQYTCAYYAHPDMSVDEAQIAKLDHVARKLGVQRGDVVYEAGSGWGGLARHLAKHYGATVRAFNISEEQVRFSRDAAKREGLADRVEYVLDDYRNMTGRCDRFVSVGMLEHVGVEHYPVLGEVVRGVLAPGGRGLIHAIGRNHTAPMNAWIEKRIFPGAYPATLAEMMRIFEGSRLSVLDVENLRLHYARTLKHWRERFEQNTGRISAMYDERFVRMWRLYLGGSEASFLTGALQLFQVVFAHATDNQVPMTRDHLYRT